MRAQRFISILLAMEHHPLSSSPSERWGEAACRTQPRASFLSCSSDQQKYRTWMHKCSTLCLAVLIRPSEETLSKSTPFYVCCVAMMFRLLWWVGEFTNLCSSLGVICVSFLPGAWDITRGCRKGSCEVRLKVVSKSRTSSVLPAANVRHGRCTSRTDFGFSEALHSSQAPLTLTSVKSRMGFATECAGIAALHRLLLSAVWGVISPNNHLQQLNPHLEFENKAGMLTASRL